jgi:hypothetical protein
MHPVDTVIFARGTEADPVAIQSLASGGVLITANLEILTDSTGRTCDSSRRSGPKS